MSRGQAPLARDGVPQTISLGSAAATSRSTIRENTLRRKATQTAAFVGLWVAGLIAVAILLLVVGYVVVNGIHVVNVEFLTTPPLGGLSGEGGMSTTIAGTVYLVLLIILLATPLGVSAAIYLVEYAQQTPGKLLPRLVGIARFGVETLAGVPSIIFGLFGYALFVVAMKLGFSLAAAAVAGACLILPVIIRTTEEALLAVPRSYREGSLALGATQWQTVSGVVLPAALPGIVTGIVLSIGRVVSETAVFFVTFGGSSNMPTSLLSPGRTMALHVYYLAMETRAFAKAMGTGAVLVLVTIAINLLVNTLSRRLMTGLRGRA